MQHSFFLLFTLVYLLSLSIPLQAVWEDEFDPHTFQITKIVKTYDDDPQLNGISYRNRFRSKGMLETDRLFLQPLIPSHTSLFHRELFDKEHTMKFFGKGIRKDYEYVKDGCIRWVNRWDTNPFSWWAIEAKENSNFVGAIGCFLDEPHQSLELVYLLTSDAEGKGYMSEAIKKAFIPYVETTIKENQFNCSHIYATIHPENQKSIALARKIGMVNESSKDIVSDNPVEARLWFILKLTKE